MKQTKAVIYTRIPLYSGYKATLEQQRTVCEDYCGNNGLVIKERILESRSGLDKERPLMDFLHNYIDQQDIKAIVCTEWTRLYRDPIKYKELYLALKDKGVEIHLVSDDLSNSLMREIINSIPPHNNKPSIN